MLDPSWPSYHGMQAPSNPMQLNSTSTQKRWNRMSSAYSTQKRCMHAGERCLAWNHIIFLHGKLFTVVDDKATARCSPRCPVMSKSIGRGIPGGLDDIIFLGDRTTDGDIVITRVATLADRLAQLNKKVTSQQPLVEMWHEDHRRWWVGK